MGKEEKNSRKGMPAAKGASSKGAVVCHVIMHCLTVGSFLLQDMLLGLLVSMNLLLSDKI